MERLKHIKETLIGQIEGQLGHLHEVDAEELGEVVDMVKDLEEAIYYCTITKAMEEADAQKRYQQPMYYTERYPYPMYDRDMDRDRGRMYYSDGQSSSAQGGRGTASNSSSGSMDSSSRYYYEREWPPIDMRDEREGRSPMSRKMYMESKELHKSKEHQMKELENYMQELTEDMVEMIRDASPEEKQLLQKKIAALASKIS